METYIFYQEVMVDRKLSLPVMYSCSGGNWTDVLLHAFYISLFTFLLLVSSSLFLLLLLPNVSSPLRLHYLHSSSSLSSIVFVFLLTLLCSFITFVQKPPWHTHIHTHTRTAPPCTYTCTYLFAHPSDIDEWSLAEMTTSLLMLSRDTAEDGEGERRRGRVRVKDEARGREGSR